MLPLIFLTGGVPPIGPNFIWAIAIGGSLNILAFTLYVRALKIADLSLTVPLVTLTPLFWLGTAPLIVQEWPTLADGIGVVLLVVGSYVLNVNAAQANQSWVAPLLAMARNPGSRLMLCVAFIWSITSNFDKIGVINSSPLFWVMSLSTTIAAGMVPFVFFRNRQSKGAVAHLLAHWKILSVTGAFNAIAITFQMLALTLAPVTQVIAVKRTSAIISVLFGHFFFREKGVRSRLIGAAIMVSGVVVMSLK